MQSGTYFKVGDNSGAKLVQCIQFTKRQMRIGDMITVAVKQALPADRGRVAKSKVYKAIICELKLKTGRMTGIHRRFDQNTVVLVNGQGDPLGTRVFCLGSFELRAAGRTKIASLAPMIF